VYKVVIEKINAFALQNDLLLKHCAPAPPAGQNV